MVVEKTYSNSISNEVVNKLDSKQYAKKVKTESKIYNYNLQSEAPGKYYYLIKSVSDNNYSDEKRTYFGDSEFTDSSILITQIVKDSPDATISLINKGLLCKGIILGSLSSNKGILFQLFNRIWQL